MSSDFLKARLYSFAVLVLLLAAVVTAWPGIPAFAFVDRGRILSTTLPNGLEVLVREEPEQKVAELQVWVGVGSRDEPAGTCRCGRTSTSLPVATSTPTPPRSRRSTTSPSHPNITERLWISWRMR